MYFSLPQKHASPEKEDVRAIYVGAMMKARKEAKENEAIGHKSVQGLRKKVDAVAAKKRRIETRVNGWVFFFCDYV